MSILRGIFGRFIAAEALGNADTTLVDKVAFAAAPAVIAGASMAGAEAGRREYEARIHPDAIDVAKHS